MGWNFRRSTKIAPGVRLNFSKKGMGVSLGPRGSKISFSPGGRITSNIGIPGTGLRYTTVLSNKSRKRQSSAKTLSTENLDNYQTRYRKSKTVKNRFPISLFVCMFFAIGFGNGIFSKNDVFSSSTEMVPNSLQTRAICLISTLALIVIGIWRYQIRQEQNRFWKDREAGYQNFETE